jgi:hypothetical protein
MRIGELLNCKVDDVDLAEQKILIYQSDKTSVGRAVYYSDDAHQALRFLDIICSSFAPLNKGLRPIIIFNNYFFKVVKGS